MKDKQTINSAFEKVFKGRGRYDKRTIHPVRDWLFGLLVFFICIATGASASALAFLKYYNVNVVEAEYTEPVVQYNEKLIGRVLELYGKRMTDFVALNAAPVPETVVETEATSTATTTAAVQETAAPVASTSTHSTSVEL